MSSTSAPPVAYQATEAWTVENTFQRTAEEVHEDRQFAYCHVCNVPTIGSNAPSPEVKCEPWPQHKRYHTRGKNLAHVVPNAKPIHTTDSSEDIGFFKYIFCLSILGNSGATPWSGRVFLLTSVSGVCTFSWSGFPSTFLSLSSSVSWQFYIFTSYWLDFFLMPLSLYVFSPDSLESWHLTLLFFLLLSLFSDTFVHRCFYAQKILREDAFTSKSLHKCLCGKK